MIECPPRFQQPPRHSSYEKGDDNGKTKAGRKNGRPRREFMAAMGSLAAFSIVPRSVLAQSGQPAPSDKLNVGCVGVGGMQGGNDVRSVSSENLYAFCDVDENFLNRAGDRYSATKLYRDYRIMLDKEQKNLDGITITIPDHMHASVALYAMERGLGVYCQKPLTQTVWEARLLTKAAKKIQCRNTDGQPGILFYRDTDRM